MRALQTIEKHLQFLQESRNSSLSSEIELGIFLKILENAKRRKFPRPGTILQMFEKFLRDRALLAEPWGEYFNLDFWSRKPTWNALNSLARHAPMPRQISSALLSVVHLCDAWAGWNRPKRDPEERTRKRESLACCDLCWRFAGGKKPRCSYHRRSQRAEYLRMSRLKPMLHDEMVRIREKIPFGLRPLTKENLKVWLTRLEHVKKYLRTSGADLDNPDPQEIIDLLDDDPSLPAIRAKEHEKIAENPEQLAGTLIAADAWLSLLEARHWGGKREGAGRPKKVDGLL